MPETTRVPVPVAGARHAVPATPSRPLRSGFGSAALTLTDEHALLLGQVAARAEEVLVAAAEQRWPQRELRALLGYLRAEVLRQAVDEERLLFTGRLTHPQRARLRQDHLRLRHCVLGLAKTASDDSGRALSRLATTSRDLLVLLESHLAAEQSLLTTAGAPHPMPATSALTGRWHECYPLTEDAVIDLDLLPAGQAVDAIAERLLRLRAGEQVELRSGTDLAPVWGRMNRLNPGGFGFAYLREGPQVWVARVTRRAVD